MASSPLSFRDALKLVLKRNLVRLVILAIFVAIWWGVTFFRSGSRYSVSPHTLVKAKLSRIQSPTRLILSLSDEQQKRYIDVRMLAADSTGFPSDISKICQKDLEDRLSPEAVWIRSVENDSQGTTIGKVLLHPPGQSESIDIGLEQIAKGCAVFCLKDVGFLSPQDQQSYDLAQIKAKEGRLGIWGQSLSGFQPPTECQPRQSQSR